MKLVERYGGAIRRNRLVAVRDAEVAEELAQEFAHRVVHGDLRKAGRLCGERNLPEPLRNHYEAATSDGSKPLVML
jgi:hypothetical protein